MKMQPQLTQHQRILVALCYLIILFVLSSVVGGSPWELLWDPSIDSSIWFYAGAFMIILGAYVVEPFFTKPTDAIANASAVLISLLGLNAKEQLFGYSIILFSAVTILALGVVTILLKDASSGPWRIVSRVAYGLVEAVGTSKVLFSVVYLAAAYSYFSAPENVSTLIGIITFWICLTFFDVIGMCVQSISRVVGIVRDRDRAELGQAIGCDNPHLYKVEVDYTKRRSHPVKYGDLVVVETSVNVGIIGMVVDIKHLINKRWLSIYVFPDGDGDVLKINMKDIKLIAEPKTVFSKDNLVYPLMIDTVEDAALRAQIDSNHVYKYRERFVGYVSSGSNINTLRFTIVRDSDKSEQPITEGTILKTMIYGYETLYQVINGDAREERLENYDRHGFIIGIARKLGKYNYDSRELETSKWMPAAYSPLFFAFRGSIPSDKIKLMAGSAIGRLPDSELTIPIKDIDALVTHNTAILGILGIGKSCLAYELIKKVSAEGIKVVCIDITNEYRKEMPLYFPDEKAIITDDENAFNDINARYAYIHYENKDKQNPDKSGNVAEYREAIRKDLCRFLFDSENMPDDKAFHATKKLRIFNLDYHLVSKGEKIGFNVITTELTQAEKTRIVATELFKILMKIPLADEKKAKVFLVFEEAHSLIPEWNSVASDGDKNATNGTAKVILQGRKYGLGSLVVTQRTANVSKSILNQCNTIFALRVFDDTGKGFLENYIGGDYAETLPTLEERHAIAIGKGLRLKQPIIIQLNNRENVIETLPKPGRQVLDGANGEDEGGEARIEGSEKNLGVRTDQ